MIVGGSDGCRVGRRQSRVGSQSIFWNAGGAPKNWQCFIALDPGHYSGNTFAEKIGDLCTAISQQDGARLPGSQRITNRHRLEVDGVEVEDSLLQRIQQA